MKFHAESTQVLDAKLQISLGHKRIERLTWDHQLQFIIFKRNRNNNGSQLVITDKRQERLPRKLLSSACKNDLRRLLFQRNGDAIDIPIHVGQKTQFGLLQYPIRALRHLKNVVMIVLQCS